MFFRRPGAIRSHDAAYWPAAYRAKYFVAACRAAATVAGANVFGTATVAGESVSPGVQPQAGDRFMAADWPRLGPEVHHPTSWA
jgi:hypothetical protein